MTSSILLLTIFLPVFNSGAKETGVAADFNALTAGKNFI